VRWMRRGEWHAKQREATRRQVEAAMSADSDVGPTAPPAVKMPKRQMRAMATHDDDDDDEEEEEGDRDKPQQMSEASAHLRTLDME